MIKEFEAKKSIKYVILCSRRLGKCLAKGTLINTVNRGILPIEEIIPGDEVYGYSSDGVLKPTKVTQVHYQGVKEVYDYMHHDRVVVTATEDHRWLTCNARTPGLKVKAGKDLIKGDKLIRMSAPDLEVGKNIPTAYVLGALLGDGCSRQNLKYTKQLYISSLNNKVPNKIAEILNVEYKNNSKINYTWTLYSENKDVKESVEFYKEWCHGRYAHEKIADLEEIKKWNRNSKLDFIAGVLDTDGCLQLNKGSLVLSFSMQAKSVIDVLEYLFLDIWGVEMGRLVDNRAKYKNGPYHTLFLKHNALIAKIYEDLDNKLVTENRKWKPEYENLTYQKSAKFTGVIKANPRFEECWDIGIDNETHLYMLANGHITHNSFMLCLLAIEKALSKSDQYIKYLTSTNEAARGIVLPLFQRILTSCPNELRPEYNVQEHTWKFKNGSQILLKGTDKDKGESLRGQSADLAIIDEAGFVDGLDTLISDILSPMIIERNGRMLLSSTPPRDNQHPFLYYIAEAEKKGTLSKRTIYDCPRFSKKQLETFTEEAGGVESETFRREYLCEIIRDKSLAIVPEFTDALAKKIVYKDEPRLEYLPDRYVSLDPGFADNAAILFGFWDFPTATLYIQKEHVEGGQNTEEIAQIIQKTETELWGKQTPYKRISDTDLRLIKDLKDLHELKFIKTEKDNKDMQINVLRIMCKNIQIRIHESCVNLINQLKYGQFKVSAAGYRDFKRTAELGHSDAIDALLYLIRNINKTRNPIPEDSYNQYYQMDNSRSSGRGSLTSNARKLSMALKRR